MMISKHVGLKEATKSVRAMKMGIDNTPDLQHIENMKMVAEACFEPLRNHVKHPIYIASFFRSVALNEATPGSSANSQHMHGALSGKEEGAIDINMAIFDSGMDNKAAFMWLAENVEFDQLIWEYGTRLCPAWIHISYCKGGNRSNLLRSIRTPDKKVIYRPQNLEDLR